MRPDQAAPTDTGRAFAGLRRFLHLPLLAVILLLAPGCVSTLDPPRSVVLGSGARLTADARRLDEVHEWARAQLERISCIVGWHEFGPPSVVGWLPPSPLMPGEVRTTYCSYPGTVTPIPPPPGWSSSQLRQVQDITIHVHTLPDTVDTFPWASLRIEGDTARVRVTRAQPDLHTAYSVYAFLHLAHRQGRLERWLPDAAEAEGYPLERAIVKGMVDVWLMGRSSFKLEPHQPMDELLHASESGYLDAFLFTARPDDFPQEREQWIRENPGGLEQYREWFLRVLGEEPPGAGARGMRGERPPTGGGP